MTYEEKIDYFWNKMNDLLTEANKAGFCYGFIGANGTDIVYWTDEDTNFSVEPTD